MGGDNEPTENRRRHILLRSGPEGGLGGLDGHEPKVTLVRCSLPFECRHALGELRTIPRSAFTLCPRALAAGPGWFSGHDQHAHHGQPLLKLENK